MAMNDVAAAPQGQAPAAAPAQIHRAPRTSSGAPSHGLIDFSDNIVQLKVGPANMTLNVHEKILTASSKFFRDILEQESSALRPSPHTIELRNHRPAMVGFYIHWLYFCQVLSNHQLRSLKQIREKAGLMAESYSTMKESRSKANRLADAYLFGDKVQDIKYKNTIILHMIVSATIPFPEVVNKIYTGTEPRSPVRRFMIDAIVRNALDTKVWTDFFNLYNEEVVRDIVNAMVKTRTAPALSPGDDLANYMEQEQKQEE